MEFNVKPDAEGVSVKPMTRTLLVPENVINLQFVERWRALLSPSLLELERESLRGREPEFSQEPERLLLERTFDLRCIKGQNPSVPVTWREGADVEKDKRMEDEQWAM